MNNVILIQNAASSMGGVEALTSRIAGELIKEGADVTILILGNSAQSRILRLFPEGCRLIFFPAPLYSSLLYPRSFWHGQWRDILPKRCDLILCFSPAGIAAMRFLRKAWYPFAKELVYVVHPRMLLLGFSEVPSYIHIVIQSLPSRAFAYMNDACRISNNPSSAQKSARDNLILPLPVNAFSEQSIGSRGLRRIVSIGRLEPGMKTYNWSFVPDFVELGDKYNLVWEIYGAGLPEDVKSLAQSIDACAGRERIKLCGEIPQSQIPMVLDNAFAFIGMGTALVQAASCGIPSIMAIAYEPSPSGYGLFSDAPFPCLGEDLGASLEKVPLRKSLEWLLRMSAQDVNEAGRKCRYHALRFSPEGFTQALRSYSLKSPSFPPVSTRTILIFWLSHILWRISTILSRSFVVKSMLRIGGRLPV